VTAKLAVLHRQPIAVQNDFSAEDRDRFRRELKEEGEEIATILRCLAKLKANPDCAEPRLDTLVEVWWRSFHNLALAMDAVDGTDKDRLFEQLLERRRAWGKIQGRAMLAATLDRRGQ
jgi:hypothetical protein